MLLNHGVVIRWRLLFVDWRSASSALHLISYIYVLQCEGLHVASVAYAVL